MEEIMEIKLLLLFIIGILLIVIAEMKYKNRLYSISLGAVMRHMDDEGLRDFDDLTPEMQSMYIREEIVSMRNEKFL